MMFVDHPSVIKLYEIFEWKNSVYLVTEYVLDNLVYAKEDNSLKNCNKLEPSLRKPLE